MNFAVTLFEAVTGHVVTAAAFVAAALYLVVRAWRALSKVVEWGKSILETLRAIELLGRARAGLAGEGNIAELVESGHAARIRYDNFSRPDILTVRIGAPDWRAELVAAGRAGGVIRSALPGPDSR